jgi:hypothetical protein
MMIFGMKKQRDHMRLAYAVIIIIMIIAVVIIVNALSSYDEAYSRMRTDTVREAVYDALITCYALEGSYPDSLDHLAQNYGLILDRDRYIYHYSIFASNILPEFDVIPKITAKGEETAFIYEEDDNE